MEDIETKLKEVASNDRKEALLMGLAR